MEGELRCHSALVICGVGVGGVGCVVLLFSLHCLFLLALWKNTVESLACRCGDRSQYTHPDVYFRSLQPYVVFTSPLTICQQCKQCGDGVDSCDVSLKQIRTCVNCRQPARRTNPLSRPYTPASRPSSSHSQYSSPGDGKSRAQKKKNRLQRYLRFAEFVCNALVRSSTDVVCVCECPIAVHMTLMNNAQCSG